MRAGWCLLALTLSLATAAGAKDGLSSLVPLVELYAADAKVQPGFDVAGIRCAGLYTAQADWARKHRIRGPSRKSLKDVELHLTRAETYRREQGQSATRAYQSTLADVQTVIGLYTRHFANRSKLRQHPWEGDTLIRGDSTYCRLLGE